MSSEEIRASVDDSSRERRMAEVLARCSDRLNAGESLDTESILKDHPDLAPDLKVAFESMRDIDSSIRAELPPSTIGDFRILRELGRGGMGIVYEAWQISMDRRVSLKILPPALLANRKALARFELEAKVAGRLQHPGIVSVYGKGIEGGAPYYAMEFVEGETLDRVLDRLRATRRPPSDPLSAVPPLARPTGIEGASPLPDSGQREAAEAPEGAPRDPGLETSFGAEEINLKYCLRVAEAFMEVAEALQYAHQKGVIHRDLKPSNLILDGKGRLRILDFGLAKLEGQEGVTVSGDFLGTPLYMSPEQAMASRVSLDHRTDIYSLGATLFEVLTRDPPFRGKDYKETLSQIIGRDPPALRRLNARIPKSLETIVLKCLRKDPADRYGTAEALAQDLRRFVRGDPIEARPQAMLEKVARRAARHKWRILAAACALLLCLTTGILIRKAVIERLARDEELYRDLVMRSVVELVWPVSRPAPEASGEILPEGPPVRAGLFEVAFAEEIDVPARAGPDPLEEAAERLKKAIRIFDEKPDAHYHLARAQLLRGSDDESIEELSLALEGDPGFVPAIALRKAVLERQAGEKAAAEGSRAGVPEGDPGWGEAWLAAHRSTARRDWKEVARAYTALLRAEAHGQKTFLGSSLEALLGRGRARLEEEDFDGALEDFAAARALWRDLVEPDLFLGRIYYLKGRKDRAEEVFEGLLDRPGARGEVALRVAGIYLCFQEPEKGLRWDERAAESPARERLRANLLVSMGRTDDALRSARRAVELDPREARSHETLGYALCALGRLDLAEGEYRAALGLDRGFFLAHESLGEVLERLGRAEDARAEYEEAARLDRKATLPLKKLGNLLYRQGKFEEALPRYRLAAQLDPKDARARSYLGEALRRLNRLDEAIEEHRKALEIDPRKADYHNNLAIALKDKDDIEGAAAALRKAIDLDPMNPRRYNVLGKLLATAKRRYADALREYEKAIEKDPQYWPAHYNRMLSLKETGEVEKSAESARKALAILERSPKKSFKDQETRSCFIHILDHLAKFAAAEGRSEEARVFVRKALSFQKGRVDLPDASAKELNQYASMLLECEPPDLRDPRAALPYAKLAVELSGEKDPEILDTLAAAHFETGDIERAIEREEQAMRLLAPQAKDKYGLALRRLIEGNLAKFKKSLQSTVDSQQKTE